MLEAFESNAISYILKPITIDKVEKALEKFNNLKATFQKEENQSNLSNLINQLKRTYKLKDILKDLV
jgi:two-component system response regulator LytT